MAGKRESRRLIGDHVMTEHDIARQELFPDRVSYCGWGIDIHPPKGFYDDGPPAVFSHKVKFSVPFRSLYSKDITNLMMAGRCISVSHVALGATRVMISCGLQGQAVGTAAGLCKQHNATPRTVGQDYITDLQQRLLKDGCYLIDLANRDPNDLARTATVQASSVSPPVNVAGQSGSDLHPLGCDRAVMFRVTGDRIDKISLLLRSENRKPTEIKLTPVRGGVKGLQFHGRPRHGDGPRAARSKGWVEFAAGAKVSRAIITLRSRRPRDSIGRWLPTVPTTRPARIARPKAGLLTRHATHTASIRPRNPMTRRQARVLKRCLPPRT